MPTEQDKLAIDIAKAEEELKQLKKHNGFDEFKSPRITLWRITRAEVEHENTLTHYRMTWLMSSQGFLFATFGLVMTAWLKGEIIQDAYLAPTLLVVISVFATYLCLCFHDALDRAQRQLKRLQDHYDEESDKLAPCDVPVPPLQYWGVAPPLRFGRADSIAVATLVVWLSLMTIAGLLLSFQSRLVAGGILLVAALSVAIGALCYRSGLKQRDTKTDDEARDAAKRK